MSEAAVTPTAKTYRYRDNGRLVIICIALLCAQIVLAVAGAATMWWQWDLLASMRDGAFSSIQQVTADAEASDRLVQLASWAQLALFVVNGILILIWVYRANANAWSMGATLDDKPGWAVGWFFVPFANLVMPFQAMKSLWAGSVDPANWRKITPPGALFVSWWTFWLLTNIVTNIGARIATRATDFEYLILGTQMMLAGDLLRIPACVLFAEIMRRIQKIQAERAAQPGGIS